jgi:AraC-like DNA-binding protein
MATTSSCTLHPRHGFDGELEPLPLFTRIKASTRQTPYQYVSAKRLAQAKVLLAQNRPLAGIAFALNFLSQANFTRTFRREFGITPGQ